MADEAYIDNFHENRITLWGLEAKATALSSAQSRLEQLVSARRELADEAIQSAYGPWAPEFRTREKRVLDRMAGGWLTLGYCASACRSWPEPSMYPGSGTSAGNALSHMARLSEPAGSDGDTSGVNTTTLDSYLHEAQRQHDEVLATLLDDVDVDGIRGEDRPYVFVAYPAPDPNITVSGTLPLNSDISPHGGEWNLLVGPVQMMSPGEIQAVLTFLRLEPIDFVGLSNDVLTYANEHREAFAREVPRRPRRPGRGVIRRPGDDGAASTPGDHDGPDVPTPNVPGPTAPGPDELAPIATIDALAVLAAHLFAFDRPSIDGSPPDGRLSFEELTAAANDESLPADARALAARLAANEALFAEIALLSGREGDPPAITADDIETFLGTLPVLEVLRGQWATFDRPDLDGVISLDELKLAAVDVALSQHARDAARFMIDHPHVLERLATYGEAPVTAPAGASGGSTDPFGGPDQDSTSCTRENLHEMVDDYRQLLGLPRLPAAAPVLPPPPPDAVPLGPPVVTPMPREVA